MDKIAHLSVAWAATLTLHLCGLGSLPVLGTVTATAVAWEARKGSSESHVEHSQDLTAGLAGMLAAEAVWQNTVVRRWKADSVRKAQQARRMVCVVTRTCPDTTRLVPRSGEAGPVLMAAGVRRGEHGRTDLLLTAVTDNPTPQ